MCSIAKVSVNPNQVQYFLAGGNSDVPVFSFGIKLWDALSRYQKSFHEIECNKYDSIYFDEGLDLLILLLALCLGFYNTF